MTTVFISWASFEYMTVEQSEVYSYSSFVGELGGILGLWLGLSVLGIVKVNIYLKINTSLDSCKL